MPKLWKYLLSQYIKIFSLSLCSFIAILFVLRFKELARFAAAAADWGKTGLFASYQIPLILPLAVPISSWIASFLLFQKLDRHSELIALRSSGLSFRFLFTPVLLASVFLSALHFTICAELAPFCRRESRSLLYRETADNPLVTLQRQRLIKIPNLYLQMKMKEEGRVAHDFLLASYNEKMGGIHLIVAKKLFLSMDSLEGENVAFIGPEWMENVGHLSMKTPLLSEAVKKSRPSLDAASLSLRLLKIRSQEKGKQAQSANMEIWRRLTLSLALFSFTLLGFAFGIESRRTPTKKGLLKAVSLGLTLLVSYLLGRSLKHHSLMALGAFFLPHLLIWIASWLHLRRIAKGVS